MATPGKKNISNTNKNHGDNGIIDSIAALRSVLMLDTPIRDVLAVGRTGNVKQLQKQPQKKLCFSPTSMTQATTPASTRNNISTLTENTPESRNKASARRSSSLSSPLFKTPTPSGLPRTSEGEQLAAKVLEKKIEVLEASHAELEERLRGEIDRRATLKATYDKLSQFQRKQSSQLEQIRGSRDTFREESTSLKKTLESERTKHSKTIAFLKSTTTNAIELELSREKQSFRSKTEQLRKRLQKLEGRYAESETLVMSLTKEVERLNTDMKKLREGHESTIREKIDIHSKEIAKYQEKLEQTESGLVEQINQERKNAEENHQKLQQVQKQRTKLRDDFWSERKKMQSELIKLQDMLKNTTDARKEQEQKVHELQDLLTDASNSRKEEELKLEEAINEINQLRQQMADDQLARKESEEKRIAELGASKNHIAANEKLQLERAELRRRLRDAERNSSNTMVLKEEDIISMENLRSEKLTMQQKLKSVEKQRDQCQNELQETQMELDGLKQNLEEAERIELQNEDLMTRLKSMSQRLEAFENLRERLNGYESDAKNKDQMLTNLQLELEKSKAIENVDAKSLNLQQELEKTKEELAYAKEKLDISKKSNLNRLVDIANHREAVRQLEGNLEEMEEKLSGETPRKRLETSEGNQKVFDVDSDIIIASPRKRMKTDSDVQEASDQDDDDEIVL